MFTKNPQNSMSLKWRKSAGGVRPSPFVPSRPKPSNSVASTKKATLQPIPPKVINPNQTGCESAPICDFPTPPVQIVSCRYHVGSELVQLPRIASVSASEIPRLTLQKLKQCNKACDFSDPNADAGSKVTKQAALNELIDCYSNTRMFARLTRDCHQALIEMFATNVFRPMPNIPRAMLECEAEIEDTAWPHLRLIYILFLKFLQCKVDPRILQFQLTPRFITNLFAVLDFPDARERDQAKTVIATIFNQVPPQRPLLRIITTNLLMGVPEGLQLNAASYLLELFYLFTEGAQLPLPPPLVTAFERVLLPLHLPYRCHKYFTPLVKCILLLIKKDARLGESLIEFMITHWPLTLDSKSELFIDELTQMLDEDSVKENLCKILSCISIAIESSSRSLAERALDFVMENQIQAMFVENPGPMLSILFPPLFRVARGHWQKSVQLKALNAMNTFMELDPMAFKDVAAKFKEDSILERAKKIKKRDLWGAVVQVAVSNDDTIDRETIEGDLTAFYGVSRGRRASKSGKQLMPLKMSTSQQRFKGVVPESEISLKDQQTRTKALATSQRLFDTVPKTIAAKPAPLPEITEPVFSFQAIAEEDETPQ